MKLSIIIPVFKSELILEELIKKLLQSLNTLATPIIYEIILVNDNGLDKCWYKIKELSKNHKEVKGIALSKNYGQHNATMAGFNYCTGDYIVTMDDDLQHPPEYIESIIEKLIEGFDVCYTNYVNRKHIFWKHYVSWINNIVSSHLLNKPYKLYLSSFRGIKKNIVDQLIKNKHNYIYIDSTILKLSPKTTSISINHQTRFEGQSTYTLSRLVALWLNMAGDFSILPIRFFSFIVLIFKPIIIYKKKKLKNVEQFRIQEKTF